MLEQKVLENVKDQLEMLRLRLGKLQETLTKLETAQDTRDKGLYLENVGNDIKKINAEVKTLQFEIKKCPS